MRIDIDIIAKKPLKFKFELIWTIKIYLFNIFCIKTIDMKKYIYPKKEKIDEENRKVVHRIVFKEEGRKSLLNIIKSIRISYLNASIGINTYDEIINAYAIALISSILSIIIANAVNDYDKKKISYNVRIPNDIVDIKFKSIIVLPLVKNISSILKLLFLFMKGGRKNGRKTSNRISNDYFNDINRKYGRC